MLQINLETDLLWCFDEQFSDEMDGELRHARERLFAVVHVHLGDIQEGLLLVLASEWRLSRDEHVRDHADAPENSTWLHTVRSGLDNNATDLFF